MHQRHHASPNENRRRAVIYVSTGLACLPRDTMCAHIYRLNYNPRFIQPLFGGRLLFLDRPQVGKPTWGHDYTTVLRRLPSPSDCHRHRKNRPTSACANGAVHRHRKKTAEERFHMLARGWLAYPVTPMRTPATAEERLYKHPQKPTLCPPKTKFPTAKPQPETV